MAEEQSRTGGDDKRSLIERVVNWLRAGYPEGLDSHDYVPLVAILGRRLTSEEIEWVVAETIKDHPPADPIDVKVLMTKALDALPSDADIERVEQRLTAAGWTVDFSAPPQQR